MIEQLNGTRETVLYQERFPIRPHLNTDAEDYPVHWQPAIELIMPLENSYKVTVEGRDFVLQPGELMLIAPGVLHSIQAPAFGSRFIFMIDPAPFQQIEGLEQIGSFFSPYTLFDSGCPESVRSSLSDTMHLLYEEYTGTQIHKYAAVYLHTLRLLIIAAQYRNIHPVGIAASGSPDSHKYAPKFIEICEYINKHCTENITLEEAASLSGFSLSHFIRLFKTFTGMTFYSYLNQRKISYAKNLLSTHPNLTINEIALRSGFHSLATFNRLFKSIAQCTPTDYRDRLRT